MSLRRRFSHQRALIEASREGRRTTVVEEQCTGGELDWGWHYPEWMIAIAADEKQKTGRYPHPREIMYLPELWKQDVDQYLALEAHHTFITGEKEPDGPDDQSVYEGSI